MKRWGDYRSDGYRRSEGVVSEMEPAVRKFRVVTVAIVVIWVTVLFIAIFAPSLEIQQPDNTLKVPVGAPK